MSVIIPTYRDGTALRRALISIENQTLQPSQIIVVDDASSDRNAETVCAATGLNVQLIALQKNVGPGEARNVGISASREPFVAFLDADDEWHREKLERQMSIMLEPSAPLLTCHEKDFDGVSWAEFGEPVKAVPIGRNRMLFSNCAPISTVIIRRDAIKYKFPQTYASEDYVFVAANVLSGVSAASLHQPLARAHKQAFGASGLSGRLHAMQLGEMRARYFLRKEGLATAGETLLLLIWGLIKYFRRLVVVFARRMVGQK